LGKVRPSRKKSGPFIDDGCAKAAITGTRTAASRLATVVCAICAFCAFCGPFHSFVLHPGRHRQGITLSPSVL
jgi:hypothetical protein